MHLDQRALRSLMLLALVAHAPLTQAQTRTSKSSATGGLVAIHSLSELYDANVNALITAASARGIIPKDGSYWILTKFTHPMIVVPLRDPTSPTKTLFLYYMERFQEHFFMQIEGASRTSKSEMRLWKATAESELLFTEDGGQLLKAPSQHTFRLKLLVAHDSLSVDDIISCIATTLNISDPVTSDWASIIASIGCSTASGLATVLTVISCFTIPDLGPGIVFGTIGCVNGAAQLISCGYLNCSSSTFSLTAAPISAIITQGQNATFTITSTFSGAFPGPVSNFSVSNLPSGASFSFSPTSISSSGGTTSLTIATTGQVALGDRALTVTGSGAGGLTASVAIELNINPSSSSTIIPYSDAITSKSIPETLAPIHLRRILS